MNDPVFNVVLTGEIKADHERNAAITALANLMKISDERVEKLLSSAPVVIKKNVDNDTGRKITTAIEKIGIVCNLAPVTETAEKAEPEAAPAPAQKPEAAKPSRPQPGYKFQISGKPDYSFVTIQIPANETLTVEASSMATMDTHIRMETKLRGGLGRFLTGESIFLNKFTAEGGPGEIGIAPGSPGDLEHVYLKNETIYLQNSAFVAASQGVAVESKWQGMIKGFFSGESLFLIRATGTGDLWFNTYGAMIEIDVSGEYVVDTGSIAAFTDGLTYNISKAGGYKSLFFSGEGFTCRFSGEGKIWVQTRRVDAFASWLYPFRPVKKSKND